MPEAGSLNRALRVLGLLLGAGAAVFITAAWSGRSGQRAGLGLVALGLALALVLLLAQRRSEHQRLQALHEWLMDPQPGDAPAGPGPIGELSLRIGKTLQERERSITLERDRLTQFLSAIEAAPSGVLLLDASDQVHWFNATAADHFGLDRSRDLLQRVTNLVRAPAFVAHLQAHRYDTEVVFPSPHGDATLSVLVRPYGDSMRVALSQDITERERSDAMRRDFVANVSHEIRSPLTVLAGFIESLTDLPLSPAERDRVLVLMRQQSQRMQALVSDLLALARIEGAPRPPLDRWTDADAMLRQIESDARALDGDRHRMAFANRGVAQLAGVESELFSACWNLVSNAMRYTPAGGSLGATWTVRAGGAAEFCVVDDGPGIAREHLPRVTERFYRIDGSRSRETGGTGLGLAIVKHVVQRHGGELLVSSEPGKGAQFRLLLPAQRVRLAAHALGVT